MPVRAHPWYSAPVPCAWRECESGWRVGGWWGHWCTSWSLFSSPPKNNNNNNKNNSLSLLLMRFLFVFAKWSGILLSYLNETEVVAVTVRLIYDHFVFCWAYYYNIYIVSLLMLLSMCVWLRMFSTPCLIPCTFYLTRGNKDIVIDWLKAPPT